MNERILIVEDNKSLSKIITRKMSQNLNFDVIQAYTFLEAQEILEDNDDFFIVLCDLNLPDAPNGEIVDFVLSYDLSVIVLTGSEDDDIRDEMLKKDIVDYVYKGNIDDVNYIFALIKRLSRNRDIKVLVVDDSMVARSDIKKILTSQMFKVLIAAHGEEALNYLELNNDIELVLTDFNMPVVDGIELTKIIRQNHTKEQIAIIAMIENDNHSISAKFLKIGANDFISKPFGKEELICRINNTLDMKEQLEDMNRLANIDFLTKVYNRRYFFKKIQSFYQDNTQFAIAMIDIDNFKNINDNYGYSVGDNIIVTLANTIKKHLKKKDLIARFEGGEFCVALRNVDKKQAVLFFAKLRKEISDINLNIGAKKISFTVSIGVSFSDESKIDKLINEADRALLKAKKSGKNRVELI